MLNSVIEVENLSKSYKLYKSSKDRLREVFLSFSGRIYFQRHEVLKEINFTIYRGESLGIIGRNGAGKSTLLKILTGVLSQTSGRCEVKGRVASLLELGAGFNPELTGRENIYFYCLINGVDRATVDKNIDEIISFADVGRFVDQPVKTYSSGMFVRLAFAVAIHTEPDILIIDEALSVGDAKFQRKCYAKFAELKSKNTTIILVSHDLDAIKKHCSRALLIEGGVIVASGIPKDVVVKYFEILYPKQVGLNQEEFVEHTHQEFSGGQLSVFPEQNVKSGTYGYGGVKINNMKLGTCKSPNIFNAGDEVTISAEFQWDVSILKEIIEKENVERDISFGFALSDASMNYIFGCNTYDSNLKIDPLDSSDAAVEIRFNMPLLKAGDYFITVAITVGTQRNHIQMKWYDGVAHIKVENNRNVFGVIAVDYEMSKVGVL